MMGKTSLVWMFSPNEYEELVGRLTGHLGRVKGRRSHRPVLEMSEASWNAIIKGNSVRVTIPVQPASLARLTKVHWARRDSALNELAGELRRLVVIYGIQPFDNPRVTISYYFRTNRRRKAEDLVPEFLLDVIYAVGLTKESSERLLGNLHLITLADRDHPRIEIEIRSAREGEVAFLGRNQGFDGEQS